MNRSRSSSLHLQMGQEVIYLILTFSLFCNVLLFLFVLKDAQPESVSATIENLRWERDNFEQQLQVERRALAELRKELEPKRKTDAALNDQIPIIPLKEADGYTFAGGSSELSPQFLGLLASTVVPKILEFAAQYDAQIIEVVGHTDGVVLSPNLKVGSKLDEAMGSMSDSAQAPALVPYDNAGLGIARAISVTRALRSAGLPLKFDIQPLSAANMIAPTDKYMPAPLKIKDASRRRIEIRLRRSYTSQQN